MVNARVRFVVASLIGCAGLMLAQGQKAEMLVGNGTSAFMTLKESPLQIAKAVVTVVEMPDASPLPAPSPAPQTGPTTRNVLVAWSLVNGAIKYQLYRSTSGTGPWLTPINNSPIVGNNYNDASALIGQTYTYALFAVGPDCTPTTPVTSVCGTSPGPATVATTVPAPPGTAVGMSSTVN